MNELRGLDVTVLGHNFRRFVGTIFTSGRYFQFFEIDTVT